MKQSIIKQKIWLIWWLILILITIFFSIYAFFDYSLILGWLIGVTFALFNIYANKLIIKNWLLKKKSTAFWRAIIKANVFIIISLIILIGIIMINKLTLDLSWSENNLKTAFTPINIFTFLGGFTLGQLMQLKSQTKQMEIKNGAI